MKVLIIGGTGHTGRFLTRQLLDNGDEVVILSSGQTPQLPIDAKERLSYVTFRYNDMFADDSFSSFLQNTGIDAVVDMLQGRSSDLYDVCLSTGVSQIVACGSLWMFGRPKVVPVPEVTQSPCPFEGYQQRYTEMQSVILRSKSDGISMSAIMPPNICGPGKIPLDGMGGRSIEAHRQHRAGKEVVLPFPGTNLIGPCDAEDVARGFFCALRNPLSADGEIFNVGSSYALTADKFISTYADIYGSRIPVCYVSAEEYIGHIVQDMGANYHFIEHMCPDISKITDRLGYRPQYTPEQSMERAVQWMIDGGMLDN